MALGFRESGSGNRKWTLVCTVPRFSQLLYRYTPKSISDSRNRIPENPVPCLRKRAVPLLQEELLKSQCPRMWLENKSQCPRMLITHLNKSQCPRMLIENFLLAAEHILKRQCPRMWLHIADLWVSCFFKKNLKENFPRKKIQLILPIGFACCVYVLNTKNRYKNRQQRNMTLSIVFASCVYKKHRGETTEEKKISLYAFLIVFARCVIH